MARMTPAEKAAWRKEHELERETHRVAGREVKASNRAENRERQAAFKRAKTDPLNDPHTLRMAELKGITPQEFLDLQAAQRVKMSAAAAKGTIAEQLAKLTPDAPAERLH